MTTTPKRNRAFTEITAVILIVAAQLVFAIGAGAVAVPPTAGGGPWPTLPTMP